MAQHHIEYFVQHIPFMAMEKELDIVCKAKSSTLYSTTLLVARKVIRRQCTIKPYVGVSIIIPIPASHELLAPSTYTIYTSAMGGGVTLIEVSSIILCIGVHSYVYSMMKCVRACLLIAEKGL